MNCALGKPVCVFTVELNIAQGLCLGYLLRLAFGRQQMCNGQYPSPSPFWVYLCCKSNNHTDMKQWYVFLWEYCSGQKVVCVLTEYIFNFLAWRWEYLTETNPPKHCCCLNSYFRAWYNCSSESFGTPEVQPGINRVYCASDFADQYTSYRTIWQQLQNINNQTILIVTSHRISGSELDSCSMSWSQYLKSPWTLPHVQALLTPTCLSVVRLAYKWLSSQSVMCGCISVYH